MRALTAAELLNAWEVGLSQEPLQRALTLLAVACPELDRQALAQESIGRRDGRLLRLRQWAFGNRFEGIVECPECGVRLELTFDQETIKSGADKDTETPEAERRATFEGITVDYRLPDSQDVAAVLAGAGLVDGRQTLLERCILSATDGSQQLPASRLPASVLDAVEAAIANADPQADVTLSLTCHACQHQWVSPFDIVSYFWGEINTWAHRLLREIHTLAAAYGWSESQILALSPWRRQMYMNLIAG